MKSKLLEKLIKDKIKIGVEVTNDTERDKLLSLFDNYKNIKWVSEDKPKEWLPKDEYPYYIYLNRNKEISFGDKIDDEFIEVDYKDLFSPRQEIHITRKDNKVHAILKENDKVIKHTIAKCHPEDEFDFKVGSKLAYDRLFEKDNKDEKTKNAKATKPKHEFKVGDKVRVRQWDDMVEEFGINEGGSINCLWHFVDGMKKFCSEIATIIGFDYAPNNRDRVYLRFNNEKLNENDWAFSTDMIEPYTPRVAKAGEYVKVIEGEDSGKIFKCTKNFWQTGGYFENFEYCYSDIVLFPSEYEVLDDYITPLNCRFIALEGSEYLTKGKIYEVKNGRFADDSGSYFPLGITLKDENDLKKYFSSKQERGIQTGYCYNGIKYIIVKE